MLQLINKHAPHFLTGLSNYLCRLPSSHAVPCEQSCLMFMKMHLSL